MHDKSLASLDYPARRCLQVENVVRDSCDAGAFETWGVGSGNTYHTNAVSDCDSGGVDGSWMNFMFQDDASVSACNTRECSSDISLSVLSRIACSTT